MPISLKLVAALSVLAEATAAALVFWHTGPRARWAKRLRHELGSPRGRLGP